MDSASRGRRRTQGHEHLCSTGRCPLPPSMRDRVHLVRLPLRPIDLEEFLQQQWDDRTVENQLSAVYGKPRHKRKVLFDLLRGEF